MSTRIIPTGIMAVALGLALASAWPAGRAEAAAQESILSAASDTGTPSGTSVEQWKKAQGKAKLVKQDAGRNEIEVEATNLVPNGLYTIWWVNKGAMSMAMGPGGGSPNNEFRADANGRATVKIQVPSNSKYEMMAIAYHADNKAHGEMPGEMGKKTFNHLMGLWPVAAAAK